MEKPNAFSTSGLTERNSQKTRWGRKLKGQFVYIFKLSTAIGPARPALLAEQRFEKRRKHYNRFDQNMMCFPKQILLDCFNPGI